MSENVVTLPVVRIERCEEDRWQPIETAPRDGTEIIGIFHRRYDESSPPTTYGPWTVAWDGRKWRSSWDEQEVISYMSDFGTEYKGPDIDPTHWQPMPGAPRSPLRHRYSISLMTISAAPAEAAELRDWIKRRLEEPV